MQDVVAGKRRTRRRGGAGGLLGSDESDDDEEDEEARALRQRLAKKRRITGDTLDELARDPAMASFHATYQMALADDTEEFAHLDRDQELDTEQKLDPDQGEGEGGDYEDDDGNEGDRRRKRGAGEDMEEDEDVEMAESSTGVEKGAKEISAAEVRKALQEVARGERVRISLWPTFSFLTSRLTGISCARSGGRIVDGSRSGRSRDATRALSVLPHIHGQSAASCAPAIRRRGHGCPFPRTFPFPFPEAPPKSIMTNEP